ncbi:uncharacterized protein LOC123623403 [Lemur catta]|uniref:uncharacterized protein LOC123623403 n=1 Tax=Lemur catta TaxID=9447 RepID=UPI001E268B1B|nr:uncharacterized protein LOC123623403 [Lemur catta]
MLTSLKRRAQRWRREAWQQAVAGKEGGIPEPGLDIAPGSARARPVYSHRSARARPLPSLPRRKSRLSRPPPRPIGPGAGSLRRLAVPGVSPGRPLRAPGGCRTETRRTRGAGRRRRVSGAGLGALGQATGLPPRDPEGAAPSLVGVVVRPWMGGPRGSCAVHRGLFHICNNRCWCRTAHNLEGPSLVMRNSKERIQLQFKSIQNLRLSLLL